MEKEPHPNSIKGLVLPKLLHFISAVLSINRGASLTIDLYRGLLSTDGDLELHHPAAVSTNTPDLQFHEVKQPSSIALGRFQSVERVRLSGGNCDLPAARCGNGGAADGQQSAGRWREGAGLLQCIGRAGLRPGDDKIGAQGRDGQRDRFHGQGDGRCGREAAVAHPIGEAVGAEVVVGRLIC